MVKNKKEGLPPFLSKLRSLQKSIIIKNADLKYT